MTDPTVPPGAFPPSGSSAPSEAESTAILLDRARSGDSTALDVLFERHLQALTRWTRGRLPRWARDLADTADLVQDVLLNTFTRIDGFRPEHDRALSAYLHQAVVNRIRDEYRKGRNRPIRRELEDDQPDSRPSPLDQAMTAELLDAYHAALDRMRPEERDLVVSRIELGLTYEEIADVLAKPNANAARSAVVRAFERLGQEMRHGR